MRTHPPVAPFLGAAVETDLSRLRADVAILGVPHGSPYPDPGLTAGCAAAPAAVRQASQRMSRFRGHWDFDLDAPFLPADGPPLLVDAGDAPGHAADAVGNGAATMASVAAILASGAVPICLGGDDSVPIPILRAFADRPPLHVVQVDAHLDFRDEVQGVADGYSSAMRRASEMEHVTQIIQVGLRGVGSARPLDLDEAREAGNVIVTSSELSRRGVEAVLELIPRSASVFVSFDLDGLDPAVMPAVSGRSPGGLAARDAIDLLLGIGPRLVGGVLSELVPERDLDGMGAALACRLAAVMAGGVGDHRNGGRRSTIV